MARSRFHQTVKRFLRKQPAARSIAELQFQLDAFRDYYNTRRPHRALSRQTPLAVFNALIKAKPSLQLAPVDHRVRHDKIDSSGKVTLRYLGKLHHIPVGTAHKNRKVRLLVAGPDVRIITDDGELIRALTLDPTRVYHSLGGRWPVHNVFATGGNDVLREDSGGPEGIRTPWPGGAIHARSNRSKATPQALRRLLVESLRRSPPTIRRASRRTA